MCLAFGMSTRSATSDGVRLPPIVPQSHTQPFLATFASYTAKEPHIEEIINTAPNGSADNYQAGQCVWYIASTIGVPRGLGNAADWIRNATAMGYQTGKPVKGAVGVSTAGYYGHVVLVEATDGNNVLVSEMNVVAPFVEDEAWYPASNFTYVYFGTF